MTTVLRVPNPKYTLHAASTSRGPMKPMATQDELNVCYAKKIYRKAERADLMIGRMRAQGLDEALQLRSYLCRICGRYHIGNAHRRRAS